METKTADKRLRIINRICLAIFAICFVNTLANFILFSLQNPHGQWDAIAVWNLKARFLYLGGSNWRAMFSPVIPWTHPDYPLFLSGFIAHCWMIMQTNAPIAGVAASAFFTLGTGAVLFLSISLFKGIMQGLVVSLLILSTPFFISHGVSQYADVTLGFLFLVTLVCLTMADESGTKSHFFFIVAGLFAGFAAWTKNEGILFFAVVLISRGIKFIFKPSKIDLKKLVCFVLGSFPVIILLFAYKHFLTPANDLRVGQHSNIMEKLTDFSRYKLVVSYIWKIGIDFGQWNTKIHYWLLALLVFFGFQIKKSLQPSILFSSLILLLTIVGYFFIYVTTPYGIEWDIDNSLNRLLIQLFPSFLFLFFIALKPFEARLITAEIKKIKPVVKNTKGVKARVKQAGK